MRRKDEALHGKLILCARELLDEQGAGALSIRAIAQRAGIAPGTVYNYFQDKGDILLALTELYWRDALERMRAEIREGCFRDRLEALFAFLRERIERSAGTMMGALAGSSGHARMAEMLRALEGVIGEWIAQDEAVRSGIWSQSFSREGYARFVVTHVVALLRSGATDIGFLREIVMRTLYD